MDEIRKQLEQVARERGNPNSARANQLVEELDDLELQGTLEKEDFDTWLFKNKDDVKKVLDLKDLAEEGANPGLNKAFYDAVSKGERILDPEDVKVTDWRGRDLPPIDHFMEMFGVKKENGKYSDDQRSAFSNPENDAYYGKRDRDWLQGKAIAEGYNGAEDLLQNVGWSGAKYQRDKQARGYDADGNIDAVKWAADLGEMLAFPRMREARLAGSEWSWQDFAGDMAELGLNFIPGVGIVTHTGKLVARVPSSVRRFLLEKGAFGLENAAVPLGSQLVDMALYDKDNPRGEFSKARVLGQAGIIGAGKYGLGAWAQKGKRVTSQAVGEQAAKQSANETMSGIKSIGEKTNPAIATRQAVLDRKAELAKQAENVTVPGATESNPRAVASPQDLIDAENHRILQEELKRLKETSELRSDYLDAVRQQKLRDKMNEVEYSRGPDGKVQVKLKYDQDGDFTWAEANDAIAGAANDDINRELARNYRMQNEAGAKPIAQLPDGRFVYQEHVTPNGLSFGDDMNYRIPFTDGRPKQAVFEYDPHLPGGKNAEVNIDPNYSGTVGRNASVEKALKADPLFARKLDKDFRPVNEYLRDFGVNAGANVLSRSGIDVLPGIAKAEWNMEDKRAEALWNNTMKRLNTDLINRDGNSPELKKRLSIAVMNWMSYGLDNIPDDVYRSDPESYKAIARTLGITDWVHPAEIGKDVPDYPTTSYSSAN